MEVDGAERGALEGTGRRTLDELLGATRHGGTGRRTLDELLGAKPELLEPSERRKLDPSDILGFLRGLAFGPAIFAGGGGKHTGA